MSKRHIVLGMPGYGHQTSAAGRAFWRACADGTELRRDESEPERDIIHREYAEGSLLASNFNSLWVTALNMAHSGQRVDYFAMLHDDIGAEDFWLDKLIDELERHDLDMLGVVSPIKDTRGITSIALARPDGDNWRPLCRLTMHEVYRLPGTFTSENVNGHPILLNTGCWVCRFDESWAKKVRFTVNDRIVYMASHKRYEKQTESEDWYFSRLCHELGLKIGCTRKVRLLHRGHEDFSNCFPWGECQVDVTMRDNGVVPENPDVIRFPFDVDGWLLPEEGDALADLARGKDVLEIGSFCGKSTICLGQTANSVVAVDPFDARNTLETPRDTFEECTANLDRYNVGNCQLVRGTIEDVDGEFDLIFIDGDHAYESVKNDIDHALRLLNPDGILAFHDYRKFPGQFNGATDQGVVDAVNELVAAGGEILSTHASLAVVRPPAAILQEI